MKRVGINHANRSICVSVAVLLSATVLLSGCSLMKEQTTTTTTQPVYTTTTTTSETELATVTEETESTTSETAPLPTGTPVPLEAFANINDEYTLEDIINEVGPYARQECPNIYIWTIDDGSEVWVCDIAAKETTNKLHEPILSQAGIAVAHVEGLKETLLFCSSSLDSIAIGNTVQFDKYQVSDLLGREFEPALEAGYYILEENGYVYFIISIGQQDARGKYVHVREVAITKIAYDIDGLKIETETVTCDVELPDIGRPACPCCIFRFDRMPDNFVVVNEYRVDVPFMGYIKDSKTWEVIPPETDVTEEAG